MAKYRKKPVEVEAIQLRLGTRMIEVLNLARDNYKVIRREGAGSILIETLEGTMRADIGDYIIRGIHGEIYPCKPDIFEKTYEKI